MNKGTLAGIVLSCTLCTSLSVHAFNPDQYHSTALTPDEGVTLDGKLMLAADTRAHSLATGDFDGDGVPDLAVLYSDSRGEFVAVYRGNHDALYPFSPEARVSKQTGTFFSAPFHREPTLYRGKSEIDFPNAEIATERGGTLVSMHLNSDAVMDYVSINADTNEPTALLSQLGISIVVNTIADKATSGDGDCSLREAINNANSNSDTTAGDCGPGQANTTDTITFAIAPLDTRASIFAVDGFPVITDAVTIQGDSQCPTSPCVELDGSVVVLPDGVDDLNALTVNTGGTTIQGLVITGWPDEGIEMIGLQGGNSIQGNYIGIGFDGETADGNAGTGVHAQSPGNTIGGSTAAARNVLSGNGLSGVSVFNLAPGEVSDASGNLIWGNYVGTNAAGTAAVGNASAGIFISEASDVIVQDNLVSGNLQGVSVFEFGVPEFSTQGTTIRNNKIGTDVTGTVALGNIENGIYIRDASNVLIGGLNPGDSNLISGNGRNVDKQRYGILLFTTDTFNGPTENNNIQGNYIGTDITGTEKLPNGLAGVGIINSSNNTVGGIRCCTSNLISGNDLFGVYIAVFPDASNGRTSTGNKIQGNKIGLSSAFQTALGNGSTGVVLSFGTSETLVGGAANVDARNRIAGNGFHGIHIQGSINNTVQNNSIGHTHGVALPNAETGIVVSDGATGNLIGGPGNTGAKALKKVDTKPGTLGTSEPQYLNVISGNAKEGIGFYSDSPDNMVYGNLIGTDDSGRSAIPNGGSGVATFSNGGQKIGGTGALRNVISGNAVYGVWLGADISNGQASSGNIVLNNLLGLGSDGVTSIPNSEGIDIIGSSGNQIEGNRIANNVNGIRILVAGSDDNVIEGNEVFDQTNSGIVTESTAGTGNVFSQNSIYNNAGHNIDLLADGPTANDSKDPDSGPNLLQNYPVLTAGGGISVTGTLNSLPSTNFTIEYFASPTCAGTGFGGGKTYLGKADVLTDANGDADVSTTLDLAAPNGFALTSTARDPAGNTSEFSQCITVDVPETIFADSFEDAEE